MNASNIPPPPGSAIRVLILKSDCDAGASLCRHVLAVHAGARCTVVQTVAAAQRVFALGAPDLFITGMEAPDGDPLDFLWLATLGRNVPRHTFVVTRHREPWLHMALRGLPVGGVLDSTSDGPEMIESALGAILQGRQYRSLSLQQAQAVPGGMDARLRQLTSSERVVFSAVGGGLHVKATAAWLGRSVNSIEASLEALRGKLGAGTTGELAIMSACYGFVRTIPTGVIRVGFGLLLADYYLGSQRPMPPTPALRAAYPEATALAGTVRRRAAL